MSKILLQGWLEDFVATTGFKLGRVYHEVRVLQICKFTTYLSGKEYCDVQLSVSDGKAMIKATICEKSVMEFEKVNRKRITQCVGLYILIQTYTFDYLPYYGDGKYDYGHAQAGRKRNIEENSCSTGEYLLRISRFCHVGGEGTGIFNSENLINLHDSEVIREKIKVRRLLLVKTGENISQVDIKANQTAGSNTSAPKQSILEGLLGNSGDCTSVSNRGNDSFLEMLVNVKPSIIRNKQQHFPENSVVQIDPRIRAMLTKVKGDDGNGDNDDNINTGCGNNRLVGQPTDMFVTSLTQEAVPGDVSNLLVEDTDCDSFEATASGDLESLNVNARETQQPHKLKNKVSSEMFEVFGDEDAFTIDADLWFDSQANR